MLNLSCHSHCSAECVGTGWNMYLSRQCARITRCFVLASKNELSGWYSLRLTGVKCRFGYIVSPVGPVALCERVPLKRDLPEGGAI